jgi:hypothetical protein
MDMDEDELSRMADYHGVIFRLEAWQNAFGMCFAVKPSQKDPVRV